jgi:hypothetical protein
VNNGFNAVLIVVVGTVAPRKARVMDEEISLKISQQQVVPARPCASMYFLCTRNRHRYRKIRTMRQIAKTNILVFKFLK